MKKLKTALLLSTALLASSAAQAQWEGNWLLGISGGYVWNNDHDVNYTIYHPASVAFPSGAVTSFSFGNDDGGNHGVWGILGGYQARCNHWLMGIELNVDWRGHNGDDDNNSFVITDAVGQNWAGSASWDRETAVGLTARLGYEMAPYFMPYIRLGAEWSQDQIDFAAATFNPVIIVNGPLAVSANGDDRTSTRFVGGLGFEVPITAWNGLSVRVEWNFISKGKDVEGSALATDNATLWVADSSAHTNLIKAALVWNFM